MHHKPFQVGDRVKLSPDTMLWTARTELRELTGDVIDLVFDGTSLERITVAYDGVREFTGMYAGLFDRVSLPWAHPRTRPFLPPPP